MGEALYKSSDVAKSIYYEGSEVTGIDLTEVSFGTQTQRLEETTVAQPAIAAYELAAYFTLYEQGLRPDAGEGHSAGELAVLAAAGSLAVREAFQLVTARGEITQNAAKQQPGKMAVIKHLTADEISTYLSDLLGSGRLFLSNLNTSMQSVLSGDAELIDQARERLKNVHVVERAKKVRFLPLAIEGAFHSPFHMKKAVEPYSQELGKVVFREPSFRIMLNNGRYVHELGTDNLRTYLANQLVNGVDFVGGTRRLVADGLKRYIDIGPVPILGKMVREEHGEMIDIVSAVDENAFTSDYK